MAESSKKRSASFTSSDDSGDDSDYDPKQHNNSDSSSDPESSETDETDSYSSSDDAPLVLQARGPIWKKQHIVCDDAPPVESAEFFGFSPWDDSAARPSYYQFFAQFFSEDVMTYLTDQTNLYLTRKLHSDKPPKRFKNYDHAPVTVPEMHKFLGCLVYMSLAHMPRKDRYFIGLLRQEMVSSQLKYNRFLTILHNLHLADTLVADTLKRGDPCFDPIAKVRPFLDMMTKSFRRNGGDGERCQAVDEQMVKFKRRAPTSLKMYMPAKPIKWGYKLWTRAGVSGYVYDLAVAGAGAPPAPCTRKTKRSRQSASSEETTDSATDLAAVLQLPVDLIRKCGLSGQVVLSLSRGLAKNSILYYDNYFASYHLAVALKKLGYDSIFTLRESRMAHCPIASEKDLKQRAAGSYDYALDIVNNVAVCAWYDKKRVLVGSSFAGIHPVGKVKRWDRVNRQHVEVDRSHIIDVYNKSMGGVDTLDMLVSLYSTNFRSKKWYMRIFYRLLDIAAVNAWILCRRHKQQNDEVYLPLYDFKMELAKDLLNTSPGSTTDDIHAVVQQTQRL